MSQGNSRKRILLYPTDRSCPTDKQDQVIVSFLSSWSLLEYAPEVAAATTDEGGEAKKNMLRVSLRRTENGEQELPKVALSDFGKTVFPALYIVGLEFCSILAEGSR